MPIVGFGGGADYGNFFASLYDSYISNTEADARQLEAKNKERQSAKDSEMFDKFQQGDISGAELLAYIRQRADDTKTDPAEHTKWTNALRDYTNSIGDQNAEDAYAQNGNVHSLIDYYQQRKSGLEKGSPEFSSISQRLYQLIDKAASDDVNLGAQRIQDNIDKGKASLGDLASFYKRSLAGLRSGSTLRTSVQSSLAQVNDAIFKQGVATNIAAIDLKFSEHKISGAEANRQLLAAASSYRTSDPASWVKIIATGQNYINTDRTNAANTNVAQIDYLFNTGQINGAEANRRIISVANTLRASDPQSFFQLIDRGNTYLTANNGISIPNPGALADFGGTGSIPSSRPGSPAWTPPVGGRGGSNNAAEAFIAAARNYLGTPYRLGAENNRATDCSGLIFQAFQDAGLGSLIDNKRLLAQGYANFFANKGDYTRDLSQAQRGDLIVYTHGGDRVSHIGIYLGDGKVMSALTTSGVTVTNVNGLDVQFKGVLAVDWSKAPARFAPPPPRRITNPSRPSNSPEPDNTPESGVKSVGPAVAQTTDLPSANAPKQPSQTDHNGNPRPYNLPTPATQDDVKNQLDTLKLLRQRAVDMADQYAKGSTSYADGTPLNDATVNQAANDALTAIDYETALSFAINDPNAANEAAIDRSTLSANLLNSGDTRQEFLFNQVLADANRQIAYSDAYDSDPDAAQRTVRSVIDRINGFAGKLDAGDPTQPERVTTGFYSSVVQPVVDAINAAQDPNTDPIDLNAKLVNVPDFIRQSITGINTVAKVNKGIADGTLVQAVVPVINNGQIVMGADGKPQTQFTAIPAQAQQNADGSTVNAPVDSGFTPVLVDGKTVWAATVPVATRDKVAVLAQDGLAQMLAASIKDKALSDWVLANLNNKGAQIPSKVLALMSPDTLLQLRANGIVTTAPLFLNGVVIPQHAGAGRYVPHQVAPEEGIKPGSFQEGAIIPSQTWVQDPLQLTWFKDALPRTARPDPSGMGTVYVAVQGENSATDPGGPQFNFAPDRGVAFPNQGDPIANQKLIDSGVLSHWVPAQVYRDATGNPTLQSQSGFDPSLSLNGSPAVSYPDIMHRDNDHTLTPPGAPPGATPGIQNSPFVFGNPWDTSTPSSFSLASLAAQATQLGIRVPHQAAPEAPSYVPPAPTPFSTGNRDNDHTLAPVRSYTPPPLPKINTPNLNQINKYTGGTSGKSSTYTPPKPTTTNIPHQALDPRFL